VRPGPLPLKHVFLYYKKGRNDLSFTKISMTKTGTEFSAQIPAVSPEAKTIEYYIQVSNEAHISYSPKLAKEKPFKIILTRN